MFQLRGSRLPARAMMQRRTLASNRMGRAMERRSLRVRLLELEWALEGSTLALSFALPPGAYATSILRELMKTPEISGSSSL